MQHDNKRNSVILAGRVEKIVRYQLGEYGRAAAIKHGSVSRSREVATLIINSRTSVALVLFEPLLGLLQEGEFFVIKGFLFGDHRRLEVRVADIRTAAEAALEAAALEAAALEAEPITPAFSLD